MTEADLRATLTALAGRPFDTELQQWVHSTDELPLMELLGAHGVSLKSEAPHPAQRVGLRVTENHSVQIKTVLRASAAEAAGMAAGDEWLGLGVAGQEWRITKLDDVAFYAGQETHITALVARDGRLLRLPLELPAHTAAPPLAKTKKAGTIPARAPDTISLSISDATALSRWTA